MDQTLVAQGMTSLGYGAYVPVFLALIGLASAIAKVYPITNPGGKILHSIALNPIPQSPSVSAPATPDTTGAQTTTASNYTQK